MLDGYKAGNITIPAEYGFVLMAATSTCFVGIIHSSLTAKYRKLSGVKYPNAYATNEHAEKDANAMTFNCAQRAHANFTDNHAGFLLSMLIVGLRYPLLAACSGAVWTVGRIVYALSYVNQGPSGRHVGSVTSGVMYFLTMLAAGWVATMLAIGH